MRDKMKFLMIVGLVLLMSVVVFAQKGPVPDKVYFDVRMDESIAIQDVAQGNTDVFFYGVHAGYIKDLDDATLNRLEIYEVPSGSYSLQFNPYPNTAPYYFDLDGEEIFNPFAIKDVRFAMNYLINRQYIVDEILDGAGGAMFSMATPGQPGTYRYNMIASKFGFTPEGDEEYALEMIETAMQEAANLPENQGRLAKEGSWWTFDGEAVTIKFYIRVDNPDLVQEGEYISQQLAKAGIQVEPLMLDRSRVMDIVYAGRPDEWLYSIYTEAWGAGATRRYWEHIVAQMYAPWYGYMPGGFADGWKYENPEMDQITQDAFNGVFLTEDEYWDLALEGLEMGIKEAVRIYVAYQTDYYVANSERFNNRFAYGLGDGLNKYTLVTADTEDGIVNATQFSSHGSLFMGAWDPVGPDGFSDSYARNIADPLYDATSFESPASGEQTFLRAKILDLDTNVSRNENGELEGHIQVPANAMEYDSAAREWVEVGYDVTSFSTGTYELIGGNYHHGIPISMVDYLYASAFAETWINEDYEGDPYYSTGYASLVGGSDIGVGSIYDFENDVITNYFDFQFPASDNRVAARGAPSWSTSANAGIGVAWEVVEALARIVVYGSESGESYSFDDGVSGTVQVDVIRPTCVDDIKAELVKMIAEEHVPFYIEDFITAEDTVVRYQAAIDFIDQYGHAYISNGPFLMTAIDFSANFVELSAFRDESYPVASHQWMEMLASSRLVIDGFDIPAMAGRGDDLMVDIFVSSINYPDRDGLPAEYGDVQLYLITDDEEYVFDTTVTRAGAFLGVIPGEITSQLEAGSYTIMAMATAEGAVPSTVTSIIYLY